MKPGPGAKVAYGGIVLVGCVVAVTIIPRSHPSSAGTLAFVPAEVDLAGEAVVFAGDKVQRTLKLRNSSDQPLVLSKLSSSCSCSVVRLADGRSLPVECPSGSELECLAEIEAPVAPGTLLIEFTAVCHSGQGEQFSSTAQVPIRPAERFAADPPVVSLGELDPDGEKQTITVTLQRHTDAPLPGIASIDAPRESGIRVAAFHMLKSAEPDERNRVPFCRLTVSIDPARVPHKLSEEVVVHFDRGEALRIPVLGWGASSL